MTERLKQIWGGFESATTRRLTGRGVDNIAVPARRDYAAPDAGFLPEGFTPPAEAAFAALRAELAAKERKLLKRNGRRQGASYEPPAPLTPEAETEGAPEAARDLIRGLRATEARISRRASDYAASPEAAAAGRRKKLFGVF